MAPNETTSPKSFVVLVTAKEAENELVFCNLKLLNYVFISSCITGILLPQ